EYAGHCDFGFLPCSGVLGSAEAGRDQVIGRRACALSGSKALTGGGDVADEPDDLDGPFAALGDDEPARREAHAVDEEVDRLVRLAVEVDDRAGGRADELADRHAAAAELGPDA